MKYLKIALAVSLILNGFFLFRAWQRRESTQKRQARITSVNKAANAMADVFRSMPNDSSEVIFAGTSITAFCPLTEYFSGVKNRGIGGNMSRNLLDRIDEVYESKPSKVFVEIGINDVTRGVPMDTLTSNVKKIVKRINTYSPTSKVYLISMAVGLDKFGNTVGRGNELYREICGSEYHCKFIDPSSEMRSGMTLRDEFTYDGVHFNSAGYRIWTDNLRPFVVE